MGKRAWGEIISLSKTPKKGRKTWGKYILKDDEVHLPISYKEGQT